MAYNLIHSDKVRTALDLRRETAAVRESYGMTLFGQASLTARRLVEAGSRFVSVFWDEFGLAGSAWDTHWEHYPRMRNEFAPASTGRSPASSPTSTAGECSTKRWWFW